MGPCKLQIINNDSNVRQQGVTVTKIICVYYFWCGRLAGGRLEILGRSIFSHKRCNLLGSAYLCRSAMMILWIIWSEWFSNKWKILKFSRKWLQTISELSCLISILIFDQIIQDVTTKINSRQCRFITRATLGETRTDRDVSFFNVCFELSQEKTFPWMWTNRLASIVFPILLQMRCRAILWTKEPAICRMIYAWTKNGRDHRVRQATYKETFARRFEISNRKVEPPKRWKDRIVHHKT